MKNARHAIVSSQNIHEGFFDVDEVVYKKEGDEGAAEKTVTRQVVRPKKAAAVLIHDTQSDSIVFSSQFRVAAMEENEGWMLEIPAGVLDEGEEPEAAARRECAEETGYAIENLELVTTYFTSPGYTTERLAIYYAQVSRADKTGAGGGNADENEEILIQEIPFSDCVLMVQDGRISDGKTLIALLWLLARKNGLV